jgi:Ca-activated chloride channel family protein
MKTRAWWLLAALVVALAAFGIVSCGKMVYSVPETTATDGAPPPSPEPSVAATGAAMQPADMLKTAQKAPGPMDQEGKPGQPPFNTEAYSRIQDNPFLRVDQNPLSTFSIDVDTASYSNLRRFLQNGQKPPKDAVRIEEMVNYFDYKYQPPTGSVPFAVDAQVASAPWNPKHRLLRIGLKGKELKIEDRPASNLVFLLDVSGSMEDPNKLPLLKQAFRMLVRHLNEKDSVAMVVYAGASGLVLDSTPCSASNQEKILGALDMLQAGGSTHGSAGLQLAYETAQKHFIKGGINRVLLATDGDFNVGTTSEGDLTRLIEEKAKSGIFLTVLGFGMGNYKDSTMEQLADKGNGNYAYIDHVMEARKVLVQQISGTLVTIAKDVKIQVDFNPAKVAGYRLIGYENRMLKAEDFEDDKKDAGEIGAGHTVTALYELVPAGVEVPGGKVTPSKYQQPGQKTAAAAGDELLSVRLRYKDPDGDASKPLEVAVKDGGRTIEQMDGDFKFAAAVAEFGMLLRESEHKAGATYDQALALAKEGKGSDDSGYRSEFIQLVDLARVLK